MKSLLFLIILLLPFVSIAQANLPEGYRLLYQQDFEALSSERDFEFAEANGWQFAEADGHGRVLELIRTNDYQPTVRSPHSIAMLKDLRFGDFVLEADYKQTGREYNHRDLCVFFGMVDKSHFYYTHIASIADPNAHNVFIVNNAPRKNFAEKTTKGVDWGSGWHRVRVERKIAEGTIKIYFDDMKTPVIEGTDKSFTYGRIGFGSFDDTGMVDNVKIWGPGFAPESGDFFKN